MKTNRFQTFLQKARQASGELNPKEIKIQRRILTDGKGNQDELKEKHIDGVYHLFDFYRMLVAYNPYPESIQSSNYFFYEWWRKFLYEVAEKYDTKRISQVNPGLKDKMNLQYETFEKNILFVSHLKALDFICGFEKLGPEDEIYEKSKEIT